jgi:four helix bundle protein
VWQRAMALSNRLGALTNGPEFVRDADLRNQLNSASLSVANNISEGFLRHRDREFLQFLRIAAGSNGEVRSCLHAACGRGYLEKAEAEKLIEEPKDQSATSPSEQRDRARRERWTIRA